MTKKVSQATCQKCRGVGSYFGPGCLRFQCECVPSPLTQYDIPIAKATSDRLAFIANKASNMLPKAPYKDPYDLRGQYDVSQPGLVEQILTQQVLEQQR